MPYHLLFALRSYPFASSANPWWLKILKRSGSYFRALQKLDYTWSLDPNLSQWTQELWFSFCDYFSSSRSHIWQCQKALICSLTHGVWATTVGNTKSKILELPLSVKLTSSKTTTWGDKRDWHYQPIPTYYASFKHTKIGWVLKNYFRVSEIIRCSCSTICVNFTEASQ